MGEAQQGRRAEGVLQLNPEALPVRNLYAHFPFCRRKCAYCSLYSRTGSTDAGRAEYVSALCACLRATPHAPTWASVYFGGGTPALCDLRPLFAVLRPHLADTTEFTVELHPADVTEDTLLALADGGVNRISLGVQSLEDPILARMGRGYTAQEAARAFAHVRQHFDNAGIDLIIGYPGEAENVAEKLATLRDWGLTHCSVYALQNERNLKDVPDDDTALDRLCAAAEVLTAQLGLGRYEISNYARPGCECRHNRAVWRGEDYLGLGEGACGRVGLLRTRGVRGAGGALLGVETETLTARADILERTLFRLRTCEGLDTTAFPEWRAVLDEDVARGHLTRRGVTYFLTPRGMEICDAILAELI